VTAAVLMHAMRQEIDERLHAAAPGAAANEALVLGHADLVTRMARQLIRRMPSKIELNDLIQAGMVGLLEAAQRYAGHEGASFATFASYRIRGAMLDSLRQSDWGPRSLRRRLRAIERVQQRIELRMCATARPAAIAEALGVTLESYYRTICDSSLSQLLSLDECGEPGPSRVWLQPVDRGPRPDEELEQEEAMLAMQSGIDALPEFERAVLLLYYDGELLLREIGVIFAMSESRVCQILKRIIGRLRIVTRRILEGDSHQRKRLCPAVFDAQSR